MAIEDLEDLMNHTLALETFLAEDEDGGYTYNASANIDNCYVVEKEFKTIDQEGNEVVASGYAIVPYASAIDVRSLLTLPNGESPAILNVKKMYDAEGTDVHHQRINFK